MCTGISLSALVAVGRYSLRDPWLLVLEWFDIGSFCYCLRGRLRTTRSFASDQLVANAYGTV